MSNRIKGFTVTLEKDLHEEDISSIVEAIKMIKGVSSVSQSIVNHEDIINRSRIKHELKVKFYDFFVNQLD